MPLKTAILIVFSWIGFYSALAQDDDKPRTSALAVIAMRYKETYVKLTYSRPQKRGREIFGGLVPYGKVWRTGANEATEITITKDVLLNGTLLKTGTYSLFTIPDKETWTIIVNKDVGLWGAYNYNQKQDVMRFQVPVQATGEQTYEPLTLKFDQRNDVADLLILWDKTKISIPVKFIH